MVLQANMIGVPMPTVTWYLGDKQLEEDVHYTMETTASLVRLKINSVGADQAGQYKVVAENKIGSDSAEFTMEVKGNLCQLSSHKFVPKSLHILSV